MTDTGQRAGAGAQAQQGSHRRGGGAGPGEVENRSAGSGRWGLGGRRGSAAAISLRSVLGGSWGAGVPVSGGEARLAAQAPSSAQNQGPLSPRPEEADGACSSHGEGQKASGHFAPAPWHQDPGHGPSSCPSRTPDSAWPVNVPPGYCTSVAATGPPQGAQPRCAL